MENPNFRRGIQRVEWFDKFSSETLLKLNITDPPDVCKNFDKLIFVFCKLHDQPKTAEDFPLFEERWRRYARNTLKTMNINWYKDLAALIVGGRDYFYSAIQNDIVWNELFKRMKTDAAANKTTPLFDWDIVEGCRELFCAVCYVLSRDEVLKTFGIE